MYQLNLSVHFSDLGLPCSVSIPSRNMCIPFAPDNSHYQCFKTDIANGVELLDADGNPITGDALTTFIGTLP
jgi:hypothetical protein